MRALFLTHYFPPEVGAPQTRIAALAGGLRERGIEVTVHTGFPNYPDGRIAPPYRNRPLRRERAADGTRIVRSAVYAAPNAGFARRVANHTRFAASALLTAPAAGAADVVVAESPPLFLAGAAVAYARAKRAPLVLNVADLWPDSAVAIGALSGRRSIAAARALEDWAYRHAAAITVPTEGMAERLEARPSAAGRAVHMPPAVDVERFAGLPRRRDARGRRCGCSTRGRSGSRTASGRCSPPRSSPGPDIVARDDRGRGRGGAGAAGARRSGAHRQRGADRDRARRAGPGPSAATPTPGS